MKRVPYPPADHDISSSWEREYRDMHRERVRAHNKHKDKPGGSMEVHAFDDPDWLRVVVEEIGEVAKVQCDHRHGVLTDAEMMRDLRMELVQVGAMVAAWICAIDHTHCGAVEATDATRDPDDQDWLFDHECSRPPHHDGAHSSWSGRRTWSSDRTHSDEVTP